MRSGESPLQPQAQPQLASWAEFRQSVLSIIAERSPCSDPKLFIAAANQGLERFGDGSLSGLRKLLDQCVRQLRASGLVEINRGQFVLTPAGSAEADILELTAELEISPCNTDKARPPAKELCSGTRPPEPKVTDRTARPSHPRRERTCAPTVNAEEDILELTAELELRSAMRDEPNTQQVAGHSEASSELPRSSLTREPNTGDEPSAMILKSQEVGTEGQGVGLKLRTPTKRAKKPPRATRLKQGRLAET